MESSNQQPETAQASAEPPDAGERRSGEERRAEPRRAEDQARRRANTIIAVVWAIAGAIVVLFIFFMALGTINPDNARAATIIVLVIAIVWVAHAWRRLYAGGYVSRPDRERRGF